jgi:hypothetical protein
LGISGRTAAAVINYGGVRLKPDLRMEKEFVDRAKAIRQGILQLRDSL